MAKRSTGSPAPGGACNGVPPAQRREPLARSVERLARDIARHPERLQAVDTGLVQRLQALVGGVEVNLDAPLSADDE